MKKKITIVQLSKEYLVLTTTFYVYQENSSNYGTDMY